MHFGALIVISHGFRSEFKHSSLDIYLAILNNSMIIEMHEDKFRISYHF